MLGIFLAFVGGETGGVSFKIFYAGEFEDKSNTI